MNDGPKSAPFAWDQRTADACGFRGVEAVILPRLETRVLPVALPGEQVVLTFGNPLPQELPLLNRIGFGCRSEDLVWVSPDLNGTPPPLPQGTIVNPFTSASLLSHTLAEHTPQSLFRGCARTIAVYVNRKKTLQSWGDDSIRVPEGCFVSTLQEIRIAIEDLLTRHDVVVYKPDFSASGIGQVHFTRESDLGNEALDCLMRPGVVQAFVEKTCDVSLQFEISTNFGHAIGNGPPVTTFLHELVGQFVGPDGDYQGGFFPTRLGPAFEAHIRRMGQCIVERLCEAGYRGPGSIDFMANEGTGEIWTTDVNARVIAPWYPLQMIRRRHPHHRALPFVMRSFQIPVGMSVSALEELFRGHLFSWQSMEGFVPFAFLPDLGFCYGAVFSEDPERCRALDRVIEETKQPLRL